MAQAEGVISTRSVGIPVLLADDLTGPAPDTFDRSRTSRYGARPVLLADDLTGAGDVGVECLRNGWKVECSFASGDAWTRSIAIRSSGSALVLDMETRRLAPRAAYLRAFRVGRELSRRGLTPAYFKIDSTLRGNLMLEADALRRSTGSRLAWLVPANPAFGRTTIGGRHYVDGRPIERTGYARDPLHPVLTGNLVAMVDAALGRGAGAVLDRTSLRQGPRSVALKRMGWIERGVRIVIADAGTDADLAAIARCIPAGDIVCGAAALARHVVRARFGGRGPQRGPGRSSGPGRGEALSFAKDRFAGPWMAVIGSLNPLTGEQVRRVENREDVRVVRLRPSGSPAISGRPGARWTILTLDTRAFDGSFRGLRGETARKAGENVARRLARAAGAELDRVRPRGLLLSGGLTAAAVCEEIGIDRFSLVGEPEPGVTVASAEWRQRKTWIVTKPGGFGRPEALGRFMGPAKPAKRNVLLCPGPAKPAKRNVLLRPGPAKLGKRNVLLRPGPAKLGKRNVLLRPGLAGKNKITVRGG